MIPVTVITGFLGSGKTTLIRNILQQPGFARTAVIVNEFGEIGLDHHLLASSDDKIFLLTSGCLCCAVRSDLVTALLDLHWRSSQGSIPPFDRVIIETSGLADPAPLMHTFMTGANVAELFTLTSIITVVDAVHGADTLDRYQEASRQLAVADKILITKTDLMDAEPLRKRIVALNPTANRTSVINGAIHPSAIFEDPRHHGRNTYGVVAPGGREGGPDAVPHTSGIESFALLRDEPIPALALTLMLQAVAEHCGEKLLRFKGLINLVETPERPVVVHGVQHVFDPLVWLDRWPDENRATRMVFIGVGIPKRWPESLLVLATEDVRLEVARRAMNPAQTLGEERKPLAVR